MFGGPKSSEFLSKKNLNNRALLVLGNVTDHPVSTEDLDNNKENIFMP
jgi:hypothetical protein